MMGSCVGTSSCLHVLNVIQIHPVSGNGNGFMKKKDGGGTKSVFGNQWVSSINVAPPIDKSNMNLPVTEREVFTLLKSWRLIKTNMTDAGVTMFLRMFELSPAVQLTFEKFRTMDEVKNLRDSTVLYTHGLVVMSAMEEILMNLDDREYLLDLILEQGSSHARFSDLTEGVFWAIKEPFLYALKKTMGEHLTHELNRLFEKTIVFIIEIMIVGFRHTRNEMAEEKRRRQELYDEEMENMVVQDLPEVEY